MNRRHFLAVAGAASLSGPFLAGPAAALHWTDIPARLSVSPGLSTLAAALQAAGLMESLKARGPFTLFAPSNEAFERLPAGALARLLRPENRAELEGILLYHLAAARVTSDQFTGRRVRIRMINGGTVAVDGTRQPITFNRNARMLAADSEGRNGVIHVIDGVLMPG